MYHKTNFVIVEGMVLEVADNDDDNDDECIIKGMVGELKLQSRRNGLIQLLL